MSAARRATHGEVWSANYKRPAPRRETWTFQFTPRCETMKIRSAGDWARMLPRRAARSPSIPLVRQRLHSPGADA